MFKQLLFGATLLFSATSFAKWKTFTKTDAFTDKKIVTVYSTEKGLPMVSLCGKERFSMTFRFQSFKYTTRGVTTTLVRIDKNKPMNLKTWSKSFGRTGVIVDLKLVKKMEQGKQMVFRPQILSRKTFKVSLDGFASEIKRARKLCK